MARPTPGIVEIVRIRDTYLVRWTMPNDSQVVGVGILSGGMLSVSYYGGTRRWSCTPLPKTGS